MNHNSVHTMMLSNNKRQRGSATIYHNIFYFNYTAQMWLCCTPEAAQSAAESSLWGCHMLTVPLSFSVSCLSRIFHVHSPLCLMLSPPFQLERASQADASRHLELLWHFYSTPITSMAHLHNTSSSSPGYLLLPSKAEVGQMLLGTPYIAFEY